MVRHSPRSVLPFGDQQAIDALQLNPMAKAAFDFARITFEVRAHYWCSRSSDNTWRRVQLLMEQNKYGQIPLSLFDQLQRVLPLADSVAEEIICEETDIWEEVIPRMFKVMRSVAEYSCDYVRRGDLGGRSRFWIFPRADDCSESGWRTSSPRGDRRNREGLDHDYRGFRTCSGC